MIKLFYIVDNTLSETMCYGLSKDENRMNECAERIRRQDYSSTDNPNVEVYSTEVPSSLYYAALVENDTGEISFWENAEEMFACIRDEQVKNYSTHQIMRETFTWWKDV